MSEAIVDVTQQLATPMTEPACDPDLNAHRAAILAKLTEVEQTRVRTYSDQLPRAELEAWFAELDSLTVEEAVDNVRLRLALNGFAL